MLCHNEVGKMEIRNQIAENIHCKECDLLHGSNFQRRKKTYLNFLPAFVCNVQASRFDTRMSMHVLVGWFAKNEFEIGTTKLHCKTLYNWLSQYIHYTFATIV